MSIIAPNMTLVSQESGSVPTPVLILGLGEAILLDRFYFKVHYEIAYLCEIRPFESLHD